MIQIQQIVENKLELPQQDKRFQSKMSKYNTELYHSLQYIEH